jgi:hypothetical protein
MAKLSKHQIDAVARMVVAGQPINLIAASVDRTPQALHHHLSTSAELQEAVEAQKARFYRGVVSSFFRHVDMLDIADAAIEEGLNSSDQRLKIETAKWLIQHVTPKPTQQSEVNVNMRGDVTHDISGILQQIGTKLSEVREARSGAAGFERHVRMGPDALPRPAASLPPTVDVTPEDESDDA